MSENVVGIDPGRSGAIAITLPDGGISVCPMPLEPADLAVLLADLRLSGVRHAYIEQTIKFAEDTKLTTASGVTYGWNCGLCHGLLLANNFEIHLVNPSLWMHSFTARTRAEMGREQWKWHLASIARTLYPNTKFRIPDADAVLIAHYGHKQTNNKLVDILT